MTEQQWLASENAGDLLGHLTGRVSPRKIRLAVCGCLRAPAVWPLLTSGSSRQAVAVSEAFADGSTDKKELGQARKRTQHLPNNLVGRLPHYVCLQDPNLLGYGFAYLVYLLRTSQPASQADLIRDLFGNPFQPLSIRPAWLTRTVVSLAQAAYEDRALPAGTLDNTRLAVLADALEEVGCNDPAILDHLRGPGPHVRGCHILDLILAKE